MDALNKVSGRDASDARGGDRFAARDVSTTSKCGCLGETVALGHGLDDSFISGQRAPIKFYPAIDYYEKCCRRLALSHDPLMAAQRHDGRRRNDMLNGLGLKPVKDRNAANNLQIARR